MRVISPHEVTGVCELCKLCVDRSEVTHFSTCRDGTNLSPLFRGLYCPIGARGFFDLFSSSVCLKLSNSSRSSAPQTKPGRVHTCLTLVCIIPRVGRIKSGVCSPARLLSLLSFYNVGDFPPPTSPAPKKSVTGSTPAHAARTMPAPGHMSGCLGKQERVECVRGAGITERRVWWEPKLFPVLCLLTGRYYGLVLSRPICTQVLVN